MKTSYYLAVSIFKLFNELKVNEEKTELCLFYRIMPPTMCLKIGDKMVTISPGLGCQLQCNLEMDSTN